MADNRARAAISIEHICKSWTPRHDELTLERVVEDFRNLSVSSNPYEDNTESIVNPQFTEWLKRAIDLRIDRLRKPYDRAVKNEYLESGVDSKILSLGVAPILDEEDKEKQEINKQQQTMNEDVEVENQQQKQPQLNEVVKKGQQKIEQQQQHDKRKKEMQKEEHLQQNENEKVIVKVR